MELKSYDFTKKKYAIKADALPYSHDELKSDMEKYFDRMPKNTIFSTNADLIKWLQEKTGKVIPNALFGKLMNQCGFASTITKVGGKTVRGFFIKLKEVVE